MATRVPRYCNSAHSCYAKAACPFPLLAAQVFAETATIQYDTGLYLSPNYNKCNFACNIFPNPPCVVACPNQGLENVRSMAGYPGVGINTLKCSHQRRTPVTINIYPTGGGTVTWLKEALDPEGRGLMHIKGIAKAQPNASLGYEFWKWDTGSLGGVNGDTTTFFIPEFISPSTGITISAYFRLPSGLTFTQSGAPPPPPPINNIHITPVVIQSLPSIYVPTDIDVQSVKWDVSQLPTELKNTYRMYLRYVHARYATDTDLVFYLKYKVGYDETENTLMFTLSKNNTYFKQKLPPGILAREMRWQITGSQVSSCEIYEAGVMGEPVIIGGR